VKVGLVPAGQHADVYIPPHGRKKVEEEQNATQTAGIPELEVIPNAADREFSGLIEVYGTRLRIAVTSETCFSAITGTHTRVRHDYLRS
jgi:hypothetical protein